VCLPFQPTVPELFLPRLFPFFPGLRVWSLKTKVLLSSWRKGNQQQFFLDSPAFLDLEIKFARTCACCCSIFFAPFVSAITCPLDALLFSNLLKQVICMLLLSLLRRMSSPFYSFFFILSESRSIVPLSSHRLERKRIGEGEKGRAIIIS
jgi:hypothetical protein